MTGSFNPATGLIFFLARCAIGKRQSCESFNPATGLIFFLADGIANDNLYRESFNPATGLIFFLACCFAVAVRVGHLLF